MLACDIEPQKRRSFGAPNASNSADPPPFQNEDSSEEVRLILEPNMTIPYRRRG